MQNFYSLEKNISNINGITNYSEQIIQSSNKKGFQINKLVFRQTAYIDNRKYLVSIEMNENDSKIKLILVDLESGNKIEKIMDKKEIISFFKNINTTLPKLKNEIQSLNSKSNKKTIKNVSNKSKNSHSSSKLSSKSSKLSFSNSKKEEKSSSDSKKEEKSSSDSKKEKKNSSDSKKEEKSSSDSKKEKKSSSDSKKEEKSSSDSKKRIETSKK